MGATYAMGDGPVDGVMTTRWSDDWLTVYQGDARAVLAELPTGSVHCVVTSPPYWGLRDYGVPGQLGLEPTPEAYVAAMVDVFREVRRVLRKDGTLWLNLGDSYASHDPGGFREGEFLNPGGRPAVKGSARNRAGTYRTAGLKPKDLVGIPWRVAFALQADGWYLRSDIIWAKPNPMPESVTDRPTKSHEYLFLLSKSPRYFYDAEAVRERAVSAWNPDDAKAPDGWATHEGGHGSFHRDGREPGRSGNKARKYGDERDRPGSHMGASVPWEGSTRNLRDVWTIATQSYPGAHFATFPEKLVEPCIKAGTSERGVCPECGAPWVREVERQPYGSLGPHQVGQDKTVVGMSRNALGGQKKWDSYVGPQTTGWRPTCGCMAPPDDPRYFDNSVPAGDHPRPEPVQASVLDPFAGSGTTGLVAQSLGRRSILIDLSADYLVQALGRNRQVPLGLTVE